jgi:protein-disulfide isomerase
VLDNNKVWSKNALLGSENATHKLVVYSDLFCPYCRKEFEGIEQNMADFKPTFLDSNKLSYELRITDLLSTASDPDENWDSTTGGEVVHCAQLQNHFWDYYQAILNKMYADYYSKGVGDRHYDRQTEADYKQHMVPRLETSYFTDVAKIVDGIDMAKMDACIKDGSGMKELKQYSKSAVKAGANSFPSFFVDGKVAKELYGIDNTYDYSKFYANIKKGLAVKGVL